MRVSVFAAFLELSACTTVSTTTLDPTMPDTMRGVWRQSAAGTVTAADCNSFTVQNIQRILTVRADGFTIFETGGRLLSVAERGTTRLRGTFDTTYADAPQRNDYLFESSADGQILTMRLIGENPGTAAIHYRRCPA